MASDDVLSSALDGLARRVSDLFTQLSALVSKVDTAVVTKEFLTATQGVFKERFKNHDERLKDLDEDLKSKVSRTELEELRTRVKNLEDDRRKLVWIVLTFVIVTVLGVAFSISTNGVPS